MPSESPGLLTAFARNVRREAAADAVFQRELAQWQEGRSAPQSAGAGRETRAKRMAQHAAAFPTVISLLRVVSLPATIPLKTLYRSLQLADFLIKDALFKREPIKVPKLPDLLTGTSSGRPNSSINSFPPGSEQRTPHSSLHTLRDFITLRFIWNRWLPGGCNALKKAVRSCKPLTRLKNTGVGRYLTHSWKDYQILRSIENNGPQRTLKALIAYEPLECATAEAAEELRKLRAGLLQSLPEGARLELEGVRRVFVRRVGVARLRRTVRCEFEFTIAGRWGGAREQAAGGAVRGIGRVSRHFAGRIDFVRRRGRWLPGSFSCVAL